MDNFSLLRLEPQQYAKLQLAELEQLVEMLEQRSAETSDGQTKLEAAQNALRLRQRLIKAKVMELERFNNRYLIFFDSTQHFTKLAGTSVVLFANLIAERIGWRYVRKEDRDHYSVSKDGVISFRRFDLLAEKLSNISVFPDKEQTAELPEIHSYVLARPYSEAEITKMREHDQNQLDQIMRIVMPLSPQPELYDDIANLFRLLDRYVRNHNDVLARAVLCEEVAPRILDMSKAYIEYANATSSNKLQYLQKIIDNNLSVRQVFALGCRTQMFQYKDAYALLQLSTKIDTFATRLYKREQFDK